MLWMRMPSQGGGRSCQGRRRQRYQLTDIIDIDNILFPGVAKKEGVGGNKQLTVILEISPVSDSNIISEAAVTTDL